MASDDIPPGTRIPPGDYPYFIPTGPIYGDERYYQEMDDRADAQERLELVQDIREGLVNPFDLSDKDLDFFTKGTMSAEEARESLAPFYGVDDPGFPNGITNEQTLDFVHQQSNKYKNRIAEIVNTEDLDVIAAVERQQSRLQQGGDLDGDGIVANDSEWSISQTDLPQDVKSQVYDVLITGGVDVPTVDGVIDKESVLTQVFGENWSDQSEEVLRGVLDVFAANDGTPIRYPEGDPRNEDADIGEEGTEVGDRAPQDGDPEDQRQEPGEEPPEEELPELPPPDDDSENDIPPGPSQETDTGEEDEFPPFPPFPDAEDDADQQPEDDFPELPPPSDTPDDTGDDTVEEEFPELPAPDDNNEPPVQDDPGESELPSDDEIELPPTDEETTDQSSESQEETEAEAEAETTTEAEDQSDEPTDQSQDLPPGELPPEEDPQPPTDEEDLPPTDQQPPGQPPGDLPPGNQTPEGEDDLPQLPPGDGGSSNEDDDMEDDGFLNKIGELFKRGLETVGGALSQAFSQGGQGGTASINNIVDLAAAAAIDRKATEYYVDALKDASDAELAFLERMIGRQEVFRPFYRVGSEMVERVNPETGQVELVPQSFLGYQLNQLRKLVNRDPSFPEGRMIQPEVDILPLIEEAAAIETIDPTVNQINVADLLLGLDTGTIPEAMRTDVNLIDPFNPEDPALRFLQDEGRRAIESAAAAEGRLNTGGTLQELQQQAIGTAAQYAGDLADIGRVQDQARLDADQQFYSQLLGSGREGFGREIDRLGAISDAQRFQDDQALQADIRRFESEADRVGEQFDMSRFANLDAINRDQTLIDQLTGLVDVGRIGAEGLTGNTSAFSTLGGNVYSQLGDAMGYEGLKRGDRFSNAIGTLFPRGGNT